MSDEKSELQENPLLDSSGPPRFDRIETRHVVPGMRALLSELEGEFQAIEDDVVSSWEGLIEPLERMGDRLAYSWGIVGHLMGVQNSDELRTAQEEVLSDVVIFGLRTGQSRAIYDGLLGIREGEQWNQLDPAQQRIVDGMLRDARHSGVGLEGEARERFNAIAEESAQLATKFSNNVLDATKSFSLILRDQDEVEGLPESWRELAAQSAREEGDAPDASAADGPWRLTLDHPSLQPFLEHGRNRALRETLYRAFISRASEGDLDNTPIIDRTLELKQEMAELLGYETFADLSLSTKMATDVAAVERLLEQLRVASIDAAKADLEEIQALADASGEHEGPLRHWDVGFWAERLREQRFDYSEEELRPYFPFPKVLEGLLALAERLFDVRFEAADGQVPVWHKDVRFIRVFDRAKSPIAAFYLDPYSRPAEKRGGAWMDECVGRSTACAAAPGKVRLPVAYLVCNQTPPVGDKPSLMSFYEIETLFHEFGHGLQHMLTRVDYGLASGIRNVEWDAVELPSQFMENWAYHRETLMGVSAHVDTGKPLPDELYEKICAARTFRAGSTMLRQLSFGLIDMELHYHYRSGGGESVFDVQRRIAERTAVMQPLPEDRFLCSFGHIFAGGYSAGYYSYKWAEVLSADAFAAFEEAGLDDEQAVAEMGGRFRDTVLALGGSRPPGEVFEAFRGRAPSPDALLRHAGLGGG
ncbi:MAG: M3 family metallopeptidase [Deltaproteobacteria bacterium]|nr:M3 family metallopeptidase [Deltaproteobacteria bacterium]MBW2723173.1 M3 family metallopeptidase [Deltaproteobacteria bacterium]